MWISIRGRNIQRRPCFAEICHVCQVYKYLQVIFVCKAESIDIMVPLPIGFSCSADDIEIVRGKDEWFRHNDLSQYLLVLSIRDSQCAGLGESAYLNVILRFHVSRFFVVLSVENCHATSDLQ